MNVRRRKTVLGIDMGTSNIVVFFSQQNKDGIWTNPESVFSVDGIPAIPAYVMFQKDGTTSIGKYAKENIGTKRVAFNAKLLIGKKNDDEIVTRLREKCGLPLRGNDRGDVHYVLSIERDDDLRIFTPREVYTQLFEKIRLEAERRTEGDIVKVCITMPVHFNAIQREETRQAALKVGFSENQLCFYEEPSAAALDHVRQNAITNQLYLVFDVGAGTFDMSIVKVRNGDIQIVCQDGDNTKGGNDLTFVMMNMILEKYHKTLRDLNDKKKLKLWNDAERYKINLSEVDELDFYLDYLADEDNDEDKIITRDEFNERIGEFVNTLIDQMDTFLSINKYSKKDIERVLFVGGCTRVPLIKEKIDEYFGKDKIDQRVNPDECVARGASLHAISQTKTKPSEPGLFARIWKPVSTTIGLAGIAAYWIFGK